MEFLVDVPPPEVDGAESGIRDNLWIWKNKEGT
jgi:hypothetical protein